MRSINIAFWNWVKETFNQNYRDEIEDYLAESTSQYDLECRQKLLMQKGMI